MPGEEPKYHPSVEKIMETKGDDTGRIKAIDLARTVADKATELRAQGDYRADTINEISDADMVIEIVSDAMKDETEVPVSDEERELQAIFGVESVGINGSISPGRAAADSYEQLKDDARSRKSDSEQTRLDQLAEARRSINDQS
jgi:hypothetical protein